MRKLIQKYQLGKGVKYNPGQTTTRKVSLGTSPYQFVDENGNPVSGYYFTDREDRKPTLTVQDQNGAWRGVTQQTDGSYKTVGDVNFTPQYELVGNNGEELTVTPNGSSWQTPYNSAFHSEDAIDFANAMTGGGLNNLSPSQWLRRMYDLKHLYNGDMSGKTYLDRALLGNEGVVSRQFAQEHPYLSTGINLGVDVLTPGAVRNMGQGLRTMGRNVYTTGNRILDEAAEGMRRTMYPEPVVVGTDGRTYAYNDIRNKIMQRADSSTTPSNPEPPTNPSPASTNGTAEPPSINNTSTSAGGGPTAEPTNNSATPTGENPPVEQKQGISAWDKIRHPRISNRRSQELYPFSWRHPINTGKNFGHYLSRKISAPYRNPFNAIFLGQALYDLYGCLSPNERPQEEQQQEEESRGYTDEDAERVWQIIDSINNIKKPEERQQAAPQTEQQQEEYQVSDEEMKQSLQKRLRALDSIPLQVK